MPHVFEGVADSVCEAIAERNRLRALNTEMLHALLAAKTLMEVMVIPEGASIELLAAIGRRKDAIDSALSKAFARPKFDIAAIARAEGRQP